MGLKMFVIKVFYCLSTNHNDIFNASSVVNNFHFPFQQRTCFHYAMRVLMHVGTNQIEAQLLVHGATFVKGLSCLPIKTSPLLALKGNLYTATQFLWSHLKEPSPYSCLISQARGTEDLMRYWVPVLRKYWVPHPMEDILVLHVIK